MIDIPRVAFLRKGDGTNPAWDFLQSIDPRVRDKLLLLLDAVTRDHRLASRPSGYWKPMRAGLAGVWELRCVGPGRTHYRLFVLIDRIAKGSDENPHFVILTGARKANATLLPEAFYESVEALTTEYWLSI